MWLKQFNLWFLSPGLYVLGHVKIGRLADVATDILNVDYQHWLNLVDNLGVKAFVELTLSGSVREGTEHLLRISGWFHGLIANFDEACRPSLQQ